MLHVVSSAIVATEIFKSQELNFISTPKFGSPDYSIYKGSHFVTAHYGDYWCFMKKLCLTRLFGVAQLNHTIDIREEEVEKLMEKIIKISREGKACDLSSELTTLTYNIICRMAIASV